MELKDIQNLIKFISKSEVSEVSIKLDNFEIKVKTGKEQILYPTVVPQPQNQIKSEHNLPQPQIAESNENSNGKSEDNSNFVILKSPMIGTFYQRPSPDKPTFVNVGSEVKVGQTLCIIEAMKLFNEIESEVTGKIVKILVDDSSPVEFDQPLFLIDPS